MLPSSYKKWLFQLYDSHPKPLDRSTDLSILLSSPRDAVCPNCLDGRRPWMIRLRLCNHWHPSTYWIAGTKDWIGRWKCLTSSSLTWYSRRRGPRGCSGIQSAARLSRCRRCERSTLFRCRRNLACHNLSKDSLLQERTMNPFWLAVPIECNMPCLCGLLELRPCTGSLPTDLWIS